MKVSRRRGADGLLRADDVAAERLVAVEQVVVDAADEVARRVEVHVHLLDDHALLALDLLGVEARVAEHVDEDVERDVAGAGGALDVVARVLLAREGVELAADPVDLGRDVARGRAALGALEEHVLGEVGDAADLGRLVARAGREHDEARHRLRLRHRRSEHANAVGQRRSLEDGHRRIVDTRCIRAWNDASRRNDPRPGPHRHRHRARSRVRPGLGRRRRHPRRGRRLDRDDGRRARHVPQRAPQGVHRRPQRRVHDAAARGEGRRLRRPSSRASTRSSASSSAASRRSATAGAWARSASAGSPARSTRSSRSRASGPPGSTSRPRPQSQVRTTSARRRLRSAGR